MTSKLIRTRDWGFTNRFSHQRLSPPGLPQNSDSESCKRSAPPTSVNGVLSLILSRFFRSRRRSFPLQPRKALRLYAPRRMKEVAFHRLDIEHRSLSGAFL